MIFSLVVPTIHRTFELARLLRSMADQREKGFQLSQVEAILVDQNKDERLAKVVRPYAGKFTILRLKAPALGQSNAKNIGLKRARGKYVAFPDDDCFYAPDTLEKVHRAFQETNDGYALFGRSMDKDSGRYLLKYPPKGRVILSAKSPDVFLGLQIAQFYTLDMARRVGDFDPDLCSGGKWGSGEETDFAIRFLKSGGEIEYRPEILVYHPLVLPETMTSEKARKYAVGFGALCRKQGLFGLLLLKILKQAAGAVFFTVKMDRRRAKICWLVAAARAKGFLDYQCSK